MVSKYFPVVKKEIHTSFFKLSLFSALFPNLSALTILTATASCVLRLTAKRTLNKTNDNESKNSSTAKPSPILSP